jgi:hypothetical protein
MKLKITSLNTNKIFLSIAISIFLFGAIIRIIGIDFGLPFLYDPDEPVFVVTAYKILATRDLNPHWFGHPGTFTIYTLAVTYAAYGMFLVFVGHFQSLANIGSSFWHEPSEFYFVGRLVMVFFAVSTLCLIYAITKRVSDHWTALLAALILAVSPLHVAYSRIIRTDIQQTFLLLLVTWFAISISRSGRWRDYLVAGFILGLSITTKYPSVVATVLIIVAWIVDVTRCQDSWIKRLPRLFGSALSSLFGTFIGSPYLFLDFKTAWKNITVEASPTHLSHTNPGFDGALSHYINGPIADNVTTLGLMFIIIGIYELARRRGSEAAVLIVFPVLYLLFISSLNLLWDRWAIPMLPFVALFAALGFKLLFTNLTRSVISPVKGTIVVAAVVVWMMFPLSITLSQMRTAIGADSRTLAFEWASDNIPQGSSVLVERYTAHLENGKYKIFIVEDGHIVETKENDKFFSTEEVVGNLADTNDIKKYGIDFVMIGNYLDRCLKDRDCYRENNLEPYFYIMKNFRLVFEAMPVEGKTSGNKVQIYKTTTN